MFRYLFHRLGDPRLAGSLEQDERDPIRRALLVALDRVEHCLDVDVAAQRGRQPMGGQDGAHLLAQRVGTGQA